MQNKPEIVKLTTAEYTQLTARKHNKTPNSISNMTRMLKPGEAFHLQTKVQPTCAYVAAKRAKFEVTVRAGSNRIGQTGFWVIRTN